MGFRFRKSFGPRGLKINLSKNGISSVSIGRAPFTVNVPVNRRGGVRTTASLPGTGLSWSEQAPSSPRRTVQEQTYRPAARPGASDGAGIKAALTAGGVLMIVSGLVLGGIGFVDHQRANSPEALAAQKAEQERVAAWEARLAESNAAEELRQEQARRDEEAKWQAAIKATQEKQQRMNAAGYYEGRRGGCFTYTSGGNKRYVDRSICAGF